MKIRVVGSPIFIDAFSALGANPTQMSWADAQPALATKAVDGQENPLSVFNAAKLHTLGQQHLTLWGYMTDPLIFVVNRNVWNNWSEADRKAVREAAEQAAAENLVAARKGVSPGDDALLKDIEKNGVTITRLTAEQREGLQGPDPSGVRQVGRNRGQGSGEKGRGRHRCRQVGPFPLRLRDRRPGPAILFLTRTTRWMTNRIPPPAPLPASNGPWRAGCMALLCLITFANVLVRYLTNASFAFTEEFSVFLLLALTLLGSAGAFADGRHIRITLLVDRLSANGRRLCSALEWLANVAMFGLLAWLGYGMAYDDFEFEVTSPGLGLPQWWYSAWLPLLSALIVLRLFLLLWRRRGGRA